MAGIPQVITEDRASGAQVVEGSLRFDKSKTQYLRKSFSAPGNRKTFTWSSWVKRSSFGDWQRIFTCEPGSNLVGGLSFTGAAEGSSPIDGIRIQQQGFSHNNHFRTTAAYRDTGWYHVVMSVNTSSSTASERMRLYVNGELQPHIYPTGGDPSVNSHFYFNGTDNFHEIGRSTQYAAPLDARMSECYWIDGQALGPEYFGYTDPLTNVWRPKKFNQFTDPISTEYSGASTLTWDDNPIGSVYTLSNGNRTATASGGSGYSGADVWSNAIPANSTTAFTLSIINSDSVGGWYFTDSQTASGTHPDERSGNMVGLRNQDLPAAFRGTFATANGYSNSGNQLNLPGCESWLTSKVDFVVYRPASGTGKVWCKANSDSTWVGGGDPSDTSSTPSFIIPDGNTYLGYTFYDRSSGDQIATLEGDGSIQQKVGANSFYLPMDGNSPIGKDQSGNGNDFEPINIGSSVDLPKATGAIPILNTNGGGTVATTGNVRTDSKTYTVTASGGNYYLDGALKPTLNAYRGGSYTFDYTGATSHPLYLSGMPDGKHNSKAYSVQFDGASGTDLQLTNHADLQVGSESNWTIEFFVRKTGSFVDYDVITGKGQGGQFEWFIEGFANGQVRFLYSANGSTTWTGDHVLIQYMNDNQWYHFAAVRNGTSFKMYVDGIETFSTTGFNIHAGTGPLHIGGYGGAASQDPPVQISNYRIVKGTSVYTSNFRRPGTTLENITNTKLLCCHDSSATTATVSPVAITSNGGVSVIQTHQPFLYIDSEGGVNTATSNTTKITIPHHAADTLYYYCNAHSGMGSSINVTTDIRKADPYAWKNVYAVPLLGTASDGSASLNVNSATKAITASGATASIGSRNFYGGSTYFDGSDVITTPDNNDFDFGTGDFTVEIWARPNSISGDQYIVSWEGGNANAAHNGINIYNGNWRIGGFNNALIGGNNGLVANQWTHIAMSRDSNKLRVFVNGVMIGTSSTGAGLNFDCSSNFTLGKYAGNADLRFTGYMSDLRVYKGVAKYTSDFIPASTNPDILPDTPSGVAGGSKLTKITDGAVGNFSSSSDSSLLTSSSSDFAFGTGDFTMEAYVYADTSQTDNWIIGLVTGNSPANCMLRVGSGGKLEFYDDPGGTGHLSPNVLPLNRWMHVAAVRSGSTLTLFENGIPVKTATVSSNFSNSVTCVIGNQTGVDRRWKGFISNVRIIKGTALYTSRFTPPTRALTNVTNTKLLCCQSTTSATAYEVSPGSITANGDAAATNFNPFTDDINTIRGQESGYATWNPLTKGSRVTLSNGNLDVTSTASSGQAATMEVVASIRTKSGKYYVEWTNISNRVAALANYAYGGTQLGVYSGGINNSLGGTTSGAGFSFTSSDVIALAVDFDNKIAYVYKNNILQYTANYTTDAELFFKDNVNSSGSGGTSSANFGQKPFKFPPPDGFQPLSLSTVQPEKVIARPDQYVGVSLWPGNGTSQNITGLKHKPDFVWIKKRAGGSARSHQLFDSVRGVYKTLHSNSAGAEDNNTNRLTAFNQDGFAVGSDDGSNGSSGTFVGWTWKAGGNKNTFNIDDVGYANASDVNMSVGSLNSSSYDQSQTWSNAVTSSTGFRSSEPATNAFDGSTSTICSAVGSGLLTFAPTGTFPSSSAIRIYLQGSGSQTVTVNGGASQTITGNSWQTVNFTNSSASSFTLTIQASGGTDSGVRAIEIGGKLLVNNGVSVTNVPSIAATGCSVGTKQGFSIISYTGDSQGGGGSIPHGLTQEPDFMIYKGRNTGDNWAIYHSSLGQAYLEFSTSATGGNAANRWSSLPTSSVIHLGSDTNINNVNHIMHVWHNVPGLQKFGTYVGNGSSDGPFIELGFKPAIFWMKAATATGNWIIIDSKRPGYNPDQKTLCPNTTAAENASGGTTNDILSNGFKVRGTTDRNSDGVTYIYCAWAEAPSMNLYGAQSNAR